MDSLAWDGHELYGLHRSAYNGFLCTIDRATVVATTPLYSFKSLAVRRSPDSDGDGLNDAEEIDIYGTDPINHDTDGDDVSDGAEVFAGTDPCDRDDYPISVDVTPPAVPSLSAWGLVMLFCLLLGAGYRARSKR